MQPLLEIEHVSKMIGGLLILNDLSFSLQEGEALGVLGPNGAGKTTTLHLISGEMPVTSGRILFDGRDVTRLSAHKRCRLGIVRTYQIPRPFTGMSVYENVLVAATFSGRAPHDCAPLCREVLAQTFLLEKSDVQAGSLRLLERKHLELARALASQPRVILLDEIGGGLTEPELHDLMQVILEIKSRGMTLVWIEHVVHALVSAVDRILAINFGTKLADGPPQDILNSKVFQEIYLGVD